MAASNDILGKMHDALAKEMLRILDSGEATASELNVIRQFLKDNGIESTAQAGTPVFKLSQALPFQDPDLPISNEG